MTEPNQQPITGTSRLDTRARLDVKLEQEALGRGTGTTVHGKAKKKNKIILDKPDPRLVLCVHDLE